MDYKIKMKMFNEHNVLEDIEIFKQGERETIKFLLTSLANDAIIDNVIRIDTRFMKLVEQSIKFENGRLTMTDKQEDIQNVFNR